MTIDLLYDSTTIGELAKFATKFGIRTITQPSFDENFPNSYTLRMDHQEPAFLEEELYVLVLLQALVSDRPIGEITADIERRCADLGAVLDRPLSDSYGIGEHPRPEDE